MPKPKKTGTPKSTILKTVPRAGGPKMAEPTTQTKLLGTDLPPQLDQAYATLMSQVVEIKSYLGVPRRGLKIFWASMEASGMLKFFDWHLAVQAAVEAGMRKRMMDPEFIKPLICHSMIAPLRPSAVPRMANLVAITAGWHALATVGGRAGTVVWAELNGAPKYAKEELSGEGSEDSDNYVEG